MTRCLGAALCLSLGGVGWSETPRRVERSWTPPGGPRSGQVRGSPETRGPRVLFICLCVLPNPRATYSIRPVGLSLLSRGRTLPGSSLAGGHNCTPLSALQSLRPSSLSGPPVSPVRGSVPHPPPPPLNEGDLRFLLPGKVEKVEDPRRPKDPNTAQTVRSETETEVHRSHVQECTGRIFLWTVA